MTRGDAARIVEWVEYHEALGFNDFYFILDAPIDETEFILRSLETKSRITIDIREADGDYYDGLTAEQRWKQVSKWRTEHAAEIESMKLPVNDALAMRQYKYFPEVLETYRASGEGWLALIDVDEFIVFPGGESVQQVVEATGARRVRLQNFNFDMRTHIDGQSVLGSNVYRWAREDIEHYGNGWQNRVKSIVQYEYLTPLVSVHAISRGPFVTLDHEVGRLHHYKPTDQGISELPYRVEDRTVADLHGI